MIPTSGCYRYVRRERLLGEISVGKLIHPGLAGFPTLISLHPGSATRSAAAASACRTPHQLRRPDENALTATVFDVTPVHTPRRPAKEFLTRLLGWQEFTPPAHMTRTR